MRGSLPHKRVVAFSAALLAALLIPLFALATDVTYTYDELGRLKRAEYDNGGIISIEEYTYDPAGNRTLKRRVTNSAGISTLQVQVTGSGKVKGVGIDCGGAVNDCTETSVASTDTLTLTALPVAGGQLLSWTGCDSTNGPLCTVSNATSRTVTAAFAVQQVSLTLSTSGTGSGAVSGAGTYNYGVQASAVATPAANSYFSNWSGDCSGTTSSLQVFMDNTKSCIANFLLKYTLTISEAGNGSGTETGAGWFMPGTNAAVTVTADANSTFTGWGGDCTAYHTSGSFSLPMDDNKICIATFSINLSVTQPVRRTWNGSSWNYALLQDAFNAVAESGEVILNMSGKYDAGQVIYDRPYSITFKGGYNTGFTVNAGTYTKISGSLTFKQGSVIVENIVIE